MDAVWRSVRGRRGGVARKGVNMRRFYFNFRQGDLYEADVEGCPFASSEEAYLGAVAASREMWLELLIRREDPRECAFVVTDKEGNELFTLAFTEILDACRSKSASKGPHEVEEPNRKPHKTVNDLSATVRATRDALRETLQLLQRVSAAADADSFDVFSGAGDTAR